MRWRTLPMGDRAVLLEVADLNEVLALAAAARELPEVADIVPGARTVLLHAHAGVSVDALRHVVQTLRPEPVAENAGGDPVTVHTVYDGPDLADVAELTGLSEDEVIQAHTGTPWRVGFGGFAPGFAYLVGGDSRLHVPRREQPRTRVPTGSVGLAGEYSGVYPRESPGGWQLIGHTELALWDLSREPPALLQLGGLVQFVRSDS